MPGQNYLGAFITCAIIGLCISLHDLQIEYSKTYFYRFKHKNGFLQLESLVRPRDTV